jgi:hypothetical protein
MSAPIPLRRDFDASQLRGLARRSKDSPQARRLLALAAIYDGATRTEAAKIGGVGQSKSPPSGGSRRETEYFNRGRRACRASAQTNERSSSV